MSPTMNRDEAPSVSKLHAQKADVVTTFGGIQYYLHQIPASTISSKSSDGSDRLFGADFNRDFYPCTVLDHSKDQLDSEQVNTIGGQFALHDDVWMPCFLGVVILQTLHSSTVFVVQDGPPIRREFEPTRMSIGPYALRPSTGEIFCVSRLWEDTCSAFIGGALAISTQPRYFRWLATGPRIAVPSRLSSGNTTEGPLMKLRFAVKDVIDVAGLETGLGNRCYRAIYHNRSCSARCVDRLLNAGAILVGKTKTSQFAEGEAPIQWSDYLAPFNPRGDSYQSPSSSSAGSAVASAAYPWLDFTIGTDTGGSTRHPAGICGTYGMRVSTNVVSTAGIYTVSPLLDSVGVFARSAPVLETVVQSLIESPPSGLILPTPPVKYKLLYPIRAQATNLQDSRRWFPYPGKAGIAADAEDLFEETIKKMELHLKCTRTPFNLEDEWRKTRPAGQDDSLDKASGDIYNVLTTHYCVRQTIDPFIADFKAANNGHSPAIDGIVKARQDYGRSSTPLQYATAMKSAQIFSQWFLGTILAKSTEDEFPLLVFPQSWGSPDYRDEQSNGPIFSSAFSIYSLSYLSGCPDCTLPVGEVPCKSRVTESEMFLPVSLSILSPPGTDLQLLALLSELEGASVLRPVAVGRRMYADIN